MNGKEFGILVDSHQKWLENRHQGKRLYLRNKRINNIYFPEINLINCKLISTSFVNSDLSDALFQNSILESVNFSETKIKGIKLSGFIFSDALLTEDNYEDFMQEFLLVYKREYILYRLKDNFCLTKFVSTKLPFILSNKLEIIDIRKGD